MLDSMLAARLTVINVGRVNGEGYPIHDQREFRHSPFFKCMTQRQPALSFYRDQLGFEITFRRPVTIPFFGIVRRDGAMIMLKGVGVL